jgi:hypothetical protein
MLLLVGCNFLLGATQARAVVKPDATFNPLVTNGGGAIYAVAVQADGKTLVGGDFVTINNVACLRIARLNVDGSLDTSFNSMPGANARVEAIALQSDGKIVIGGQFTIVNNTPHLSLARLLGTVQVPADFDGDARADVSVWNPTDHNWYIIQSSNNTTRVHYYWGNGSLGDKAVPGDYDGDSRTDLAVWRGSEGNWYIVQSQTNTVSLRNWGNNTDTPVPADYDGDGKTDIAVWRASEGNWYIIRSFTGQVQLQYLGGSGDVPAPSAYLPQ